MESPINLAGVVNLIRKVSNLIIAMDRMDIRLIRQRERLEGWRWEVVGPADITADNAD